MASSSNELLTLSFRLAYFVHCDRELAIRIATDALSKLEVAAAAQDKRLYYTPVGRSTPSLPPHGQRTKVAMGEAHLLQRLVYIESDPYERAQESDANISQLDEEDMVVRFVKHLIRVTTKRNSFYVTLGLSRLLFNFSTSETAEIYNAVIQDCDRMKDDYYYRSRKRKLIQEMHERFGGLLRLQKGRHGEERFEHDTGPAADIVCPSLNHFTPWKTGCTIPEGWDAAGAELPSLKFNGDDPDGEHPVEIRRMHSVIHPDCFSRLTDALGWGSPNNRLTAPRFSLPNGRQNNPPRDRGGNGLSLSDKELALINGELSERAMRRKSFSAGLLKIMVDGVERQTLDPRLHKSVTLSLEDGAELIEIIGQRDDEPLLLAAHVLGECDSSGEESLSITLEGGQRFTFRVTPASADSDSRVEIAYSETRLVPKLMLVMNRAFSGLTGRSAKTSGRRSLKPVVALAAGTLLTSALAISFLVLKKTGNNNDISGKQVAKETVKPQPQPTAQSGGIPFIESSPKVESRSPEKIRPRTKSLGGSSDLTDDGTRSLSSTAPASTNLLKVKRVFVGELGDGEFAAAVRQALNAGFGSGSQFSAATSTQDADAMFKGHANGPNASGKGKVALKLIGPDGATLWSAEVTGTPEQIAAEVNQRLKSEVERLQKKSGDRQN